VFFNLFAAAEPYISVTVTCGTHAMIRESSGVSKVEFSRCLDRCPHQSQETENLWESVTKPWNVDDKAAKKRLV